MLSSPGLSRRPRLGSQALCPTKRDGRDEPGHDTPLRPTYKKGRLTEPAFFFVRSTHDHWQSVRLTVRSPPRSSLRTVRVAQSPFGPVPSVSVVVFFSVPRNPPRSTVVVEDEGARSITTGGCCGSTTTAGGPRSSITVVCAAAPVAAPSEPSAAAANATVSTLS